MSEPASIEELTDSLKRYVTTNYELIKLEATERTSTIGSSTISVLLAGLAGLLFIFFLSIGAGFYLAVYVGNIYSGFAIVAGFYLLITLILVLGRKKLIERPLCDKYIRKLFSKI